MSNRNFLLKGTLLLTLSGFLTKIIGFIYRIFLSQKIGAQGMGIYQLIFPVYTLCYALAAGGIQTAISRLVAAKAALKDEQESAMFSPVNFSGCCHFYSDRIFSVPSRELVCRTFFIRRAMYPSFKNIGIFPSFWCVSRLCQRLLSRQKKTFCSCFRPAH